MPVTSGKRAFLELLAQEGVEYIFGNPGTTELAVMDALAADDRLRYILGLQEAVVMAMAGGYAQASRRLCAVNLHAAPGLGNAMGMLYDAQQANAPMIVTAGQQDQSFVPTEPLLYADLAVLARPLVKWSADVRTVSDLPRMVHRAATVALAPPAGPVFLSVPGDVLNANADLELGAPTRVATRIRGDLAAIARAARLIAESQRPIVVAGDGVAQTDALAEIVVLAELVGAPVYMEGVSNATSFPTRHPLFHGPLPRQPAPIRRILDRHDVLISVGADLFTLSLPLHAELIEPAPPGLKIVHIDSDPWELGKNYPTDCAIFGDIKSTLPEIAGAAEGAMTQEQSAQAQARKAAAIAEAKSIRAHLSDAASRSAAKLPLQPLAVLQAIGAVLPKDAVVVEEILSSAEGVRHFIASDDSRSFFGFRGGGIGWGLPASIGIKLAQPERPVVALIGDGSAICAIQALWTAAHYRIPVVFVIFNNRSYRILKQRTHAMGGDAARSDRFIGMDLTDPAIEFVGLARSLGVDARGVATLPELQAALSAALKGDRPMLIDVALDTAFKP